MTITCCPWKEVCSINIPSFAAHVDLFANTLAHGECLSDYIAFVGEDMRGGNHAASICRDIGLFFAILSSMCAVVSLEGRYPKLIYLLQIYLSIHQPQAKPTTVALLKPS